MSVFNLYAYIFSLKKSNYTLIKNSVHFFGITGMLYLDGFRSGVVFFFSKQYINSFLCVVKTLGIF